MMTSSVTKVGILVAAIVSLVGLSACQQQDEPAPTAEAPVETEQPPAEGTRAPAVTVSALVNPLPSAVVPTFTALSAAPANPPLTTVPTTAEAVAENDQENSDMIVASRMNIQIGDTVLTAALVENSSVDALKEALSEGPITVNMLDYESMEKVGPLGLDLPRNDTQITTEAGDIILYQGSSLVIYYAPNSWNFTRLGRLINVTAEELRETLGEGNVTVTLSLP